MGLVSGSSATILACYGGRPDICTFYWVGSPSSLEGLATVLKNLKQEGKAIGGETRQSQAGGNDAATCNGQRRGRKKIAMGQ